MSCSPEGFPMIWQKPAFHEILDCLEKHRVDPPVWNLKASRAEILTERDTTVQDRREIVSYLSSVISSNLGWIEDEDQREQLWTEASRRLAERCGRSAMGEITRRWPFGGHEGDEPRSSFELTLREPSLSGDSLGLKTWASSYVLSRLLPRFAATSLSHLLSPAPLPGLSVLELGSGTGLLGLAAACTWRTAVVLTDLPEIVPNLIHNVELNRSTFQPLGGEIEAGSLTWGGLKEESDARFHCLNKFKIVLAADPLYDYDHPGLLAGAIHSQLSLDEDARALVMVAQRDETTHRLLSSFRDEMSRHQYPLVCIEENIAHGQDDWDQDDESGQVECWWGLFKRQYPVHS